MPSECTQGTQPRDWLINLHIKDIQQITERVDRIRNIYSSIIDKLWIPQPLQWWSEVWSNQLDSPKWLVQIALMLKYVDDLLSSSIHDLWYIEDNL